MIAPSKSEFVSFTSSPHKSVTGYVSVQGSSNVSVLVPPIPVTEVENDVLVDVEDLALEDVKAASNLNCQSGLNEADVFQTIMDEISTLPVTSVCHIPCGVRCLLAEILSFEFQQAVRSNLWGFVRLPFFAKAVLSPPPRGGGQEKKACGECLPNTSNETVAIWRSCFFVD